MENNITTDKWILSTAILMSLINLGYVIYLFPTESSDLIESYEKYIQVVLIQFLLILLSFKLYKKQLEKSLLKKLDESIKIEKIIERIIWCNRYVLQTKKEDSSKDNNEENKEKWQKDKKDFANNFIYPLFPESKVSFNQVSQMIENSLSGNSLGGIKPPIDGIEVVNHS